MFQLGHNTLLSASEDDSGDAAMKLSGRLYGTVG